MKKLIGLILILACVGAWTPAHATAITFDSLNGVNDNSLNKATPTTNLGNYNLVWMRAISDSTDERGHFGAASIDDSLSAHGTITVDSMYFIYTRDRIYNSTTDSVYLWPVQVMGSRDWNEAQETWNIWKTGSSWSTAGGDTMLSIAKVDTLTAHTADTRDTIIVRRGTLGGTAFLDSSKTSTGNTGFLLIARQNQIGADSKCAAIDIFSTEYATTEQRPVLIYFYTSGEAPPASTSARRRILSGGTIMGDLAHISAQKVDSILRAEGIEQWYCDYPTDWWPSRQGKE